MRHLREFRAGKPACYPDQAVYAEYACAEFGPAFQDLDGGTGLLFSVESKSRRIHFGAGRCSWYPQNSATAATLASDKYFTNVILERAGVATLGGDYFFLHDRHRAHRPIGHERENALEYFRKLGASAFVKPLLGSRGDFAQILHGEAALDRYLQMVSQTYDAVLIQPIVTGLEYRIFLLDDEVLYAARKHPPFLLGDAVHSIRELLIAHNAALQSRGLSPARKCGARRLARRRPARRRTLGDSGADEFERRGQDDVRGPPAPRQLSRWRRRPPGRSAFASPRWICLRRSAEIPRRWR